jgi:hypothetical protein
MNTNDAVILGVMVILTDDGGLFVFSICFPVEWKKSKVLYSENFVCLHQSLLEVCCSLFDIRANYIDHEGI